MAVATSQDSPWPWRLAYAAASLFIVASTGTNLVYGLLVTTYRPE